ncbi:MAG: hypothetical protein KJ871_09450 [Alphaproteobacteria bacterium]|nr:hypothetical protein [Alphaproteobacteria bacterium]MBU2084171.1 hypothetical protein [Alphaproteobacteria bacterium]MBU2144294.1 hypothetical protein [Alphaproteobacteria bacterium]MBU2196448.1 hypothetical protein [Alphaproteobacteria bacterium]
MQKQRPFILILLALLQPLSGALAPLAGIGTPIGNATRDLGAPEQPLPVFFSIWSVIFAAYLGFALFMLLRREPWMDRIAMPLTLAGLMNVVWMLSAQLIASQPLDFALLFPIGAAAWASAWQFDRLRGMGGSLAKLTADAATGLLSGWITVAIAISIPLTIRHFSSLGPTDLPWLMLWATLVTASLATWAFTRFISRSPWFFVSLGWGLLGIILNNWTITDMHWLAIMTGVVAVIVLSLRLTRGAHGAVQAA